MAPPKSKTSSAPAESKPVSVVAAPVVAAPQKGGKKVAAAKAAAPVAPVVAEAVVVATPVTSKVVVKKAKAVVAAVEAKVVPVASVAPVKGKGKKADAVAAPVQKAGAKKAVAPKAEKAPKTPKAPKAKKEDVEAEDAEADAKGVRSFKVQLPGNEEYTGRFTGLTPYQAANKALSKFFRENKTAKSEISFSIRESTRGSKRSTYTYNGKREKLDVPVKYSIKSPDGVAREIVKEYKNKLTKVKKADVPVVVAAPAAA